MANFLYFVSGRSSGEARVQLSTSSNALRMLWRAIVTQPHHRGPIYVLRRGIVAAPGINHWLSMRQRVVYTFALLTPTKPLRWSNFHLTLPAQSNHTYPWGIYTVFESAAAGHNSYSRTEISKRAFHVAAPNLWNSSPDVVRSADGLLVHGFQRNLKTVLFCLVFAA